MPGSGWQVLSDVREWSEDPTGFAEAVGIAFRKSGRAYRPLPDIRE